MQELKAEASSLEDAIRNLTKGNETVFDIIREIGADGVPKARVELTEKVVEPEKARSPKRAHEFFSVDGFRDYLKTYAGDKCVVLADPGTDRMAAVLDDTAERGFEIVTYNPDLHPLYRPWAELFGNAVRVGDFAAFLAEHRKSVTEPDGRDLLLSMRQIRMSKKVEMACGIGPNATNGVMVETKIAGEQRSNIVDFPDSITINVPIHVGKPSIDLEVDLLIFEQNDVICVKAVCPDAKEAIIAEFEADLEELSEAGVGSVVSLGRIAHAAWAEVRSK